MSKSKAVFIEKIITSIVYGYRMDHIKKWFFEREAKPWKVEWKRIVSLIKISDFPNMLFFSDIFYTMKNHICCELVSLSFLH